MKVGELQQHLGKLDPKLDIVCYCEDEAFLCEGRGFMLLEVQGVNVSHAERTRLGDETPYLKLGKGPNSVPIAFLDVTADI